MNCCCPYTRSASRFFSWFARRYRKRFESNGFEPSQRQLLAGLAQVGYRDSRLLEIGSGVGHLHQTLLEQGARSAVGVDLAPDMVEEARAWAEERGLAGRTTYMAGDFMELREHIEPADVTLLDKVVCCYPNADGLIHASLAKTRGVYALTYPRSRWFIRLGVAVAAIVMRLFGSAFRPYVHDPQQIERWIADEQFAKQYQAETPVWLTQVYRKS